MVDGSEWFAEHDVLGGIAWYQKGGGDYGYIVTRSYISPTSASVQMTMECEALKVTCESGGMLTNQ